MRLPRWIWPLLSCLLLAGWVAPRTAFACWDGFYARAPHVYVQGGDDRWDVGRARAIGRYLPAIEAMLVAHGAEVEAYYGQATLTTPNGERELQYTDGQMGSLYRVLRRALRAPDRPATRQAFTIQVSASRDRAAAERFAAALSQQEVGEPGAYEAGGFPALNPTAHVVALADGRGPLYRVVIGTFIDRADAERVAAAVRGRVSHAFVRTL